ncbi:cell division protein FtsA [Dissulfurispira sp.]|uniref:cell division protein FtsA n=1 Tax=Dissulfurispira sp. TaxID=2817609 RepID=UPI002FD93F03
MAAEKRKRNSSVIVGLDVGTTKICAIAGEVTEDGINMLSVSSHPSNGLRKGVVIDIEATANSIKKTVSDVEEQTGISVREVYVGIAGSHIKSFSSYGAVGIKGKEVTSEDVERAIDSASAVYVPLDREILHVLPTDFILDGQDGIKDPVGMAGVRLEVKVYIVTGAVASVQNLLKCCERAGLEVVDIVLQPLASAEATLNNDERDMGIALVDIGGGTTDIAIYREGWLRHTAVLGIGGNHFTNDISVGLRLPFNEAERVKKRYGSIVPEIDNAEVDVVAIDGQVRGIPRKYITEILQPRCEELLELVRQEIHAVHNNGIAVSGVVLTGGSSLLSGFDRMAEAILSMPVRIGYPHLSHQNFSHQNFSGDGHGMHVLKGEFNNPMYATGIGLVLYGIGSVMPSERGGFSSDLFSRVLNKMTGWFKKIAGRR